MTMKTEEIITMVQLGYEENGKEVKEKEERT